MDEARRRVVVSDDTPSPSHDFLDLNGQQVHAFALEMQNLGFQRMTEKLVAMLESGTWKQFRDGLGQWEFLESEFDYFLSSQGITRDDLVNGVKDIDAKAKLDQAMDETRAGQGERRAVLEVRADNPSRAGRTIEPFGLTAREAKTLGEDRKPRPALGARVRQWRKTGSQIGKPSIEPKPLVDRLYARARRLSEAELAELIERLSELQGATRTP